MAENTMEDLRWCPVVCVLLFLLVNGAHGTLSRKQRLAGGEEVGLNSGDKYHFHVKVYFKAWWSTSLKPECQGVLYTDKFVLTVAHCLRTDTGHHYVKCGNQKIRVQQVIKHSGFNINSYYPVLPNDIALLKLESSFSLGDNDQCATASLPDNTGDYFYGRTGYVVSWASDYGTIGRLKEDQFKVLTVSECNQRQSFGSLLSTSVHLCGISLQETASLCSGDAGMPFILDGSDKVIGLGSWFLGKCDNSKPGVFTRVANYVDWVTDQVTSDLGVGALPDSQSGSKPNALPDS